MSASQELEQQITAAHAITKGVDALNDATLAGYRGACKLAGADPAEQATSTTGIGTSGSGSPTAPGGEVTPSPAPNRATVDSPANRAAQRQRQRNGVSAVDALNTPSGKGSGPPSPKELRSGTATGFSHQGNAAKAERAAVESHAGPADERSRLEPSLDRRGGDGDRGGGGPTEEGTDRGVAPESGVEGETPAAAGTGGGGAGGGGSDRDQDGVGRGKNDAAVAAAAEAEQSAASARVEKESPETSKEEDAMDVDDVVKDDVDAEALDLEVLTMKTDTYKNVKDGDSATKARQPTEKPSHNRHRGQAAPPALPPPPRATMEGEAAKEGDRERERGQHVPGGDVPSTRKKCRAATEAVEVDAGVGVSTFSDVDKDEEGPAATRKIRDKAAARPGSKRNKNNGSSNDGKGDDEVEEVVTPPPLAVGRKQFPRRSAAKATSMNYYEGSDVDVVDDSDSSDEDDETLEELAKKKYAAKKSDSKAVTILAGGVVVDGGVMATAVTLATEARRENLNDPDGSNGKQMQPSALKKGPFFANPAKSPAVVQLDIDNASKEELEVAPLKRVPTDAPNPPLQEDAGVPRIATAIAVGNLLGLTNEGKWDWHFGELVRFQNKQGHCHVPQNQKLGRWVCNQRAARSNGTLAGDRAKRLEGLGFAWGPGRGRRRPPPRRKRADDRGEMASALDFVLRQETTNGAQKRRSGKAGAVAIVASQVAMRADDWEELVPALNLVLNDPSFDSDEINSFKRGVWELARGLAQKKHSATRGGAPVREGMDSEKAAAAGPAAGRSARCAPQGGAAEGWELGTSGKPLTSFSGAAKLKSTGPVVPPEKAIAGALRKQRRQLAGSSSTNSEPATSSRSEQGSNSGLSLAGKEDSKEKTKRSNEEERGGKATKKETLENGDETVGVAHERTGAPAGEDLMDTGDEHEARTPRSQLL